VHVCVCVCVCTNRKPIGQLRAGPPQYVQTTIGCPQCRTKWEPDARPQYSLFMGNWAKQVHCQLCLFVFGCATALHSCPHCQSSFEYDSSLYDSVVTCQKCSKTFGFPYYPVNQHLIDQNTLEAWRETREREKTKARETRARARRGDAGDTGGEADGDSEKLQLLIGACIMEEECPLCHKRVKSKHRLHVMECANATSMQPGTGAAQSRKAPAKPTAPATATPKKTTAVKTTRGAAKTATSAAKTRKPAAKRARRRASMSDTESEPSPSSEDETESESSFDESDDDESD